MIAFLFFIFISFLHSNDIKPQNIEAGRRGDLYKVWVYFNKKDSTRIVDLDDASIKRRIKHNLFEPTKYDYLLNQNYIDEIKELDVEVNIQSRWLNAVSVIADIEKINLIKKLPFVKKIKPVYQHTKKKSIQDIGNMNDQSRNIEYGSSYDQIEQINCRIPHIAGYFGQGVRVLYLDTGYELGHTAYDSLNLIAQYDFVNNDENTANETDQEILENQDNHGTLCLSVMAGYAPGNLIGPAFKSEYLLAKTEIMAEEIQQEEDNYVAALEWGESLGADIACASLGYLDWYSYEDLDGNSAVTTIAIDIASNLGVLCINSAGNEGDDPWYYIITPADADSVISVGAVDRDGIIANFSSRGPTYDGRIKPEVCALGVSTYCVRSNTEDIYRTASGTSFSAPLAAGAAAVVLSANPEWTNMQVREAMMMTASLSNSPDNMYGYGILNTWAAINYQFTTAIKDEEITPNALKVFDAYPNPFNPTTSIRIQSESILPNIILSIFNVNGQLIQTLEKGATNAHSMDIKWDGSRNSSGVYFIKIAWPGGSRTQKITLLN